MLGGACVCACVGGVPPPAMPCPDRRPEPPPVGTPPARPCLPAPAGEAAEGIAAYERALALQPRHAEALYNLGVACAEQGQADRALFM